MKVIIAGSRGFDDYAQLCQVCDHMLQEQSEVEIVSGTAKGADNLGERYARDRGYQVKQFPADWARYGRSAGPKRNKGMASYADALIAFWDGSSAVPKSMIDLATKAGLRVKVEILQ